MQAFPLCLLEGCSICWFNTVCFVLCFKNFPASRALALSLTISFNDVSAALYTLIADAMNPSFDSLLPSPQRGRAAHHLPRGLHPHPPPTGARPPPTGRRSASGSSDSMTARLLLGGALFLLVFPGSSFILVEDDDLKFHKEIIRSQVNIQESGLMHLISEKESSIGLTRRAIGDEKSFWDTFIAKKNQLAMLGEEHPAKLLVRRLDFWLYYVAYFCGSTIDLVYSNNLGQIALSLGESSDTTMLITLYSSFFFFGRLLSAALDYVRATSFIHMMVTDSSTVCMGRDCYFLNICVVWLPIGGGIRLKFSSLLED